MEAPGSNESEEQTTTSDSVDTAVVSTGADGQQLQEKTQTPTGMLVPTAGHSTSSTISSTRPSSSVLKIPPGVLVVGVAGATRSGKSTLARALRQQLPGKPQWKLNQDSYFKVIGETPNCIDFGRLKKQLGVHIADAGAEARAQKSPQVVIAEGFLLFADSEISEACGVKIFLDISKEICLSRRKESKKTEGLSPAKFDQYFEKFIWTGYEAHGQAPAEGTLRIDASHTPEDVVFTQAMAAVEPALAATLKAVRAPLHKRTCAASQVLPLGDGKPLV
eukprot:TRINITY_DN76605_c0_g1_i1.p1 TRINITY_DN76605_c0_g1~~TRINITY_DN76605_c0_g1_i1.p1  ORF type:complete len:277 (+),score=43.77 TRINITY_DN76605_c0_g1_i1:209-1039(+)